MRDGNLLKEIEVHYAVEDGNSLQEMEIQCRRNKFIKGDKRLLWKIEMTIRDQLWQILLIQIVAHGDKLWQTEINCLRWR